MAVDESTFTDPAEAALSGVTASEHDPAAEHTVVGGSFRSDIPEIPASGADVGEQEESEAPAANQLTIPGSVPGYSLNVGGDKPTVASVKLQGGSMAVEGQFSKGETVTLMVEVRVQSIEIADTLGPDGAVVKTERRHRMRMTGVRRLDS